MKLNRSALIASVSRCIKN